MAKKGEKKLRPLVDPKDVYVTSDLSIEEVARLFRGRKSASVGNLKVRSARENWMEARTKYRARISERLRVEQEEASEEIARRQLRDARSVQSVGKGILAAASHAIERMGGVAGLLGPKPRPREILYAIKVGSEVLSSGLDVERELLGGRISPDLPKIVFEIRELPAVASGGNGDSPSGNGDESPSGNGDSPNGKERVDG